LKKRTLVACALGALAGTASAQSSVTVFGVLDVNARYVSNDGYASRKLLGTDGLNSSRLGFRGIEDLGDGLKAGFWLEGALAPDTGAGDVPAGGGLTFRRRSTVSLISNTWGELRLGRDFTPVFWTRAIYDPFGFNGIGLEGNVDPNALPQPTYVRSSNSVAYFLPATLGGVYGHFMIAPSEGGANTKYHAARLGYAKGPLDVSIAASKQSLNGGANAFTSRVVGGSYNFGVATLQAVYNHDHNDTGAGTTFKHWLLGTVVPLGQGEVHASYNKMDAGSGNGAKQLAVGYVYNLSKRTALYGTVSSLSNDGAFAQSIDLSAFPGNTKVAPGGKSKGYELGIRHFF
jgi:predicted porin